MIEIFMAIESIPLPLGGYFITDSFASKGSEGLPDNFLRIRKTV